MSKKPFQKEKLLLIAKQLEQESDERHPITTKDMIAMLARNGVDAERKSIYRDIECLQNNGWDIIKADGNSGYYLASRAFELAELKLMVDAVQASKFITEKKSQELIHKIETLTSRHEANQLQRQVVVKNRTKTDNEKIFYNVDAIYQGIQMKHPITFVYCEWNESKELVPKKDGKRYEVSPGLLCWDDEYYYLVAWDESSSILKHFRVDKMRDIRVEDKLEMKGTKTLREVDPARYAAKTFGMFAGEECKVDLRCTKDAIGIVIDRFGKGVWMVKQSDGDYIVHVTVAVSNQFFGWLCSVNPMVTLVGPEEIVNHYRNFVKSC